MWRMEWWLAATVGFVLTMCAVAQARADHGTWETERVWVEPVVETRSVWIPGRWEDHSVWVPGRWDTQTRVVEDRVWQSRMVWVASGYQEERWRWVEGGYWKEVWDAHGFEVDYVWVDTSHWESYEVLVDTSHWEDHGSWVTLHREEVTSVWVPGHWTTKRRWIKGYYETRRVVVSPGHYESRRRWVSLPHPTPTPAPTTRPATSAPHVPGATPRPNCRIPSGIYKVTDYYAGTSVEETESGIRYGTKTDNRPNDLYAVDLGSYSKGVSSPYDGAAFNGRKRDVNGKLLAGTFYRNYRKRNGCFVPTSIVFFQDDRVRFTTGALPTPTQTPASKASPTETLGPDEPVADPVVGNPVIADSDLGSPPDGSDGPQVDPTPTIDPGPESTPTRRPEPMSTPTSQPTARPPGGRPFPTESPTPAHDPPTGTFRAAPVLAGSAIEADGTGFRSIEVLRGAPMDLWVRLDVQPPVTDPSASVTLERWTFIRGENDRPGGTRPGDTGGPSDRLRFQWNDVTPVVHGRLDPYMIHLRARIRVTYSDGVVQSFDLNESIAVTVRFQGATTWENRR